MPFDVNSKLKEIVDDERARAVLDKHISGASTTAYGAAYVTEGDFVLS